MDASQRLRHLLDHILDFPRSNSSHGGGFDEVGVRDVLAFSVHCGAMLAVDARARGEVVGRGEAPAVFVVEAEREVLGVVVLIARLHVEYHEPHHAFHFTLVLREPGGQADEVLVVEAWEAV